ncbi:MAG: tRNA (adenine(22)-N(1))-methyltransferase TrmK [Clostridia bacterium]
MTKRQLAIIELLPTCNVLCDVGCDHGIIGAQALATNKAKKVIFTDISAPSLNKARLLCQNVNLTNCEFICQDGLGNIACDCAVIGGMGGLEILDILRQATTLPEMLLLQPMRSLETLRQEIIKNYKILVDKIVFDKKYYNLLLLVKGSDSLTHSELIFGRSNINTNNPDFKIYLEHELKKCDTILQKTSLNNVISRREQILLLLNKEQI